MIAPEDQGRDLCERGHVSRRQSRRRRRRQAGPLRQKQALDARRIQHRRPRGKKARLRMTHEDGAAQLDRQFSHIRPRGVWRREQRVEIRDHFLIELVDVLDGKLLVRPDLAVARAKAEHPPGKLMIGPQDPRQIGRRPRPCTDIVEDLRVKAGPRATGLIGEIHRVTFAHEVLVPAHSTVGRLLPRLRTEAAPVHHDHRNLVAVLRDLVLDIHLVHGDVAARGEALVLSADEEIADLFQNERRLIGGHGRARQARQGREEHRSEAHVSHSCPFIPVARHPVKRQPATRARSACQGPRETARSTPGAPARPAPSRSCRP